MKTKEYSWVGTAVMALIAVPHMASAQVAGSFLRPGAQAAPGTSVVQAAPVNRSSSQPSFGMRSAPSFVPMGSGALERGSRPGYTNSNNSGMGQGPVVVLPEGYTQFHSSGSSWSNNYGQNYGSNNYGQNYPRPNYLPPVGPGNGYFNNLTPPVGPANGFGQNTQNIQVPERRHRPGWEDGNNYVYGVPTYPVIVTFPPLLGGYYYGGYSDNYAPNCTYPSVYSVYSGFPPYIYSPNMIVVGQPYVPDYATPYLPFYAPTYQTVYNENTYYVGSQSRVDELEAGGDKAKAALQNAYAANSFQAAFADIAHAWTDGSLTLLRRHLRDKDTRISVSLNSRYSYSIASGDFSEITRDALDRLQTVSFDFTHLRKAKNGDVTAFGTHVYRVAEGSVSNAGDGKTVPFDQSGPYDQTNDPVNGAEKTVYVSYTLRRHDGEWYITAIDSADHDLADADVK